MATTPTLRDRERRIAPSGLEYRAKADSAALIKAAVAAIGEDPLRLRAVVTGRSREVLSALSEVVVIEPLP